METHDFPVLASDVPANDLARNVYCVLGLPIDALDMPMILRRIDAAAASRSPFLISTPNLNFLVNSRSDSEFRESVLDSDLCPADGMPVVWIARLIGVPIRQRVSGSDIFEALKAPDRLGRTPEGFPIRRRAGCCRGGCQNAQCSAVGVELRGHVRSRLRVGR